MKIFPNGFAVIFGLINFTIQFDKIRVIGVLETGKDTVNKMLGCNFISL